MEAKAYVEHREGGYWVAGTRVSLDSLVYAFRDGQTAESLAQSFPVLTLEQVYGAIAYYLANHAVIDAYLRQQEAELASLHQQMKKLYPFFRTHASEAEFQAVWQLFAEIM